jgi:hypothetical protein
MSIVHYASERLGQILVEFIIAHGCPEFGGRPQHHCAAAMLDAHAEA